MAKVLLTGVTGYLGSHTTIRLLKQGHEVVGTLRSKDRISSIRAVIKQHTRHIDNLSFIEADLMDSDVWQVAVQGVDYVLHMASPIPLEIPKNPDELIKPAKEGTINILKAASRAGIKRVVMTSSIAAVSYGKVRTKHFTENDWSDETNTKDHTAYTISKTIAEKAAWNFMKNDKSGLELAVINPGTILGPVLDTNYSASVAVVQMLLDGSTPFMPKIGWSLVDVRSVADIHILAMTSEKAANQRFLATNQYYTIEDVSNVLRKQYPDRKVPTKKLPDFLLNFVSKFDKKLKNVTMELDVRRTHDNNKAKSLLGWEPLDDKQAIIDTADSLMKFGIV